MYQVKYHKRVLKFLKKQPKDVKERIIKIFDSLKQNPFNHTNFDIKPLKGFDNIFRLRIGKFRIIFEIKKTELLIYVIAIGSRGDIYKK